MSKTKKLTAGVPIVDSSGAVTPVSIAELAVLVGERLGVQGATYVVEQTGWIRIAKIGSSSGIINFTHAYNTTPTKAAVIAVCGAYDFNRVSAKIITGNPSVFNKLRFISKGKECYLEVYSVLSSQNQWSFKTFTVDCQSTSEPFELYKTLTPGYAPETGYAIKEFTLDDLQMGGGINAAP